MKKKLYKFISDIAYRIFVDHIKNELTTDLYLVEDGKTVKVLSKCLNVPRFGEMIVFEKSFNTHIYFKVSTVMYGETTATAYLNGKVTKPKQS